MSRIQTQQSISYPSSTSKINLINYPSSSTNNPTYQEFLQKNCSTVIIDNNISESSDHFLRNKNNIVLCISEDLEFIEKPQVDLKLKFDHLKKLNNQNLNLGNIFVIPETDQNIIYIINKQFYWENANYETLFNCLLKFKDTLIKHKINSINLPRLGIGFDKLS